MSALLGELLSGAYVCSFLRRSCALVYGSMRIISRSAAILHLWRYCHTQARTGFLWSSQSPCPSLPNLCVSSCGRFVFVAFGSRLTFETL